MSSIVVDFDTLVSHFDSIEQLIHDGYQILVPTNTVRRRRGSSQQNIENIATYFSIDHYVRIGAIELIDVDGNPDDAIIRLCEERSAPILTYDPVYASLAIAHGVPFFSIQPEPYNGYAELYVTKEQLDTLSQERVLPYSSSELYPNQYVNVKYDSDGGILARYTGQELARLHLPNYPFGVRPKNLEQTYAIDALTDPAIPLVTLEGSAGSGKNYMALASAFEMVLEQKLYKRIVITRLVVPIGRDIGFLPGSKKAKMSHWLAAFSDNAGKLLHDRDMFYDYVEKGLIEVEALTFVRGRELHDAYIIVDECQNLDRHQIKTIVTRVGEDSKLVLLGDMSQIDEPKVYTGNGFSYLIERMKHSKLAAHVRLTRTVRSSIAEEAVRVL